MRCLHLTPKLLERIRPAIWIVEKAINNIKTQLDPGSCSGAAESKLKQLVSQSSAEADTSFFRQCSDRSRRWELPLGRRHMVADRKTLLPIKAVESFRQQRN